jgi:hypothetical protein
VSSASNTQTTPASPRIINWMSVAALISFIAELAMLATHKATLHKPPPISELILSLLTLFLGAGAVIYRIRDRQNIILGRWLGGICMTLGLIVFAVQSVSIHKAQESIQFQHMRDIAKACIAYARAHDGNYPAHLLVLIRDGRIKPADLSDPTNGLVAIKLPPQWNKLSTKEQEFFIHHEGSDFRYAGQGLTLAAGGRITPNIRKIILLFRNSQEPINSGPIAFADGKVRYFSGLQMIKVLHRCNIARKEIGLPPLSFDQPDQTTPDRK